MSLHRDNFRAQALSLSFPPPLNTCGDRLQQEWRAGELP